MKRILLSFFFLIPWIVLNSQVKHPIPKGDDVRIGLSLSGGGAKGFAHIGVLKVIDSLGVKIDYISGTSMGAIVGGLYAAGYRAKDIEQIVMETDFYTLIANEKSRQESSFFNKSVDKYLLSIPIKDGKINVLPTAISTGQKNIYILRELFKNVSNVDDFSKLPIPFMCVATNLESGKMELFEKGDLVSAIMASSAFPSLMDPVKIGDSLYIDGAMTVNYPSKPLKDKGMDVVIGVDLSQGLATRDQLNSLIDILNQVTDYSIQKETKNQYQYTDINIHPNLKGMSATSYGDKQQILDSGYREALKYTSTLDQLPKAEDRLLRAPSSTIFSDLYKIDRIALENNNLFSENYVLGKMNLTLPSLQSYRSINKMIDKLYATNNYRLINYDIIKENDQNTLKLFVNEDDTRFFLKFGLHYDEIFKTGLLVNLTAKRLLLKNSTISLDMIIGDSPRYYLNYSMDNGYIPGFGFYSSGMSYDQKDLKGTITADELWFRNELFIQSIWRDRYALGAGVSSDYVETEYALTQATLTDRFFNPYAFIKSDTQNDRSFPTKGVQLSLEGKIIDLFDDTTNNSTFQLKGDFRINIPITSFYTHRVKIFGGTTIGTNLPDFYRFKLGGEFEQNLGNHVSFYGYQLGQHSGQHILSITNEVQFKLLKNLFLIPNLSFASTLEENHSMEDIFHFEHSSLGIGAGYRSPFGQISMNYSKSFNKEQNGIFNVALGHWF